VVWSSDIEVHHDVIQSPDSSFYAAVRESEDYRGMRINLPAIVRLSPDGQELHRWKSFENLDEIRDRFDPRLLIDTLLDSLLAEARTMSPETAEAFLASARSGPMPWGRRTDQFHLNTISILPDTPVGRRDGRFRMGNLLICFRNLNQIAVLDQDTWELLWTWGADDLDWPHLPVMLESGRILVFDNGTHRVYSRLIEVNPVTEKIEWEYVGEPHRAFFTPEKGSAQRLPNGNTLVCEGDMGRSFEVARDGRIVWEWFNPVSQKGHREQIYRMWRIAPEVVEPLLERYDRR
jgi:hypothetical protein